MENKQQKPRNFGMDVTIKALIVVGMVILLLIPVLLLQNKVREREQRKDEAVSAIADKWSRSQTICGPVLTVPFVKSVEDQLRPGRLEEVTTLHSFTPDNLEIASDIVPETRHYGMYEAVLYTSSIEISGEFAPMDLAGSGIGIPDMSGALLTLEMSDLRGLSNQLTIDVSGQQYRAEAGGSRTATYSDGEYYSAQQLVVRPRLDTLSGAISFRCTMELRGSEGLSFVPIGKTTTVSLAGAWSHPSFTGGYSPEHNVGAAGIDNFTANWTVLNYNRDIPDSWDGGIEELTPTSFGVELVTGTDQYQQNERAVKYALLFIVLTFMVFFFVEVLTLKRIHPVQYLLVGAALLIFYTLLLSLSEIAGFGRAYLVSAVATVGLITFYTAAIFRNAGETAMLSGILGGLYAYLYFILQMENYTLLVGSVGLFVILGVVMFISRKVNWYRGNEVSE